MELPAEPVQHVSAFEDRFEQDCVGLSEREALLLLEPGSRQAPPDLATLPETGLDLRVHIAAIEEQLIRQALERSSSVVAQAARLLGLRRTTLVEKLRKYGIGGVDEVTGD
jgi:sigma-54 specific flagellar transcriptional regulator A